MKLRPQATGLCLGVGAWWSMSWRGCQVVAQAARVMQTRRRTKRLRPSTNSYIRIAAGPNNGRTQRIVWVEQQASLRLPCQRAERHRALLVAHPVRNALRQTLCPTPQRCGEAACAWPPRLPRPRSSLRHSNRTRRSSRSVRIRSCAAWPTRRAGKVFVYHPTARQVWCGN